MVEDSLGNEREVHVSVCKQTLQKLSAHCRSEEKKDCNGSKELSTVLAKFIEVTEVCDTQRRLVEAEIEEKRREQERKH